MKKNMQLFTPAEVKKLDSLVPKCIPKEGIKPYLLATTEDRKEMVRVASEPEYIKLGHTPELESERLLKKAVEAQKTYCLCDSVGKCPLVPKSNPRMMYPSFDGTIHQFFPCDEGWWDLRQIVSSLSEYIDSKDNDFNKIKIL